MCASSARTGLCGGQWVTAVPTATAKDLRLNREVAIKVLPAAVSTDTERLRRFEQEAQAAGALNHPNILAVYDVGTHDGMFYVVSELLEGETLRKRLAESPIPPRKAIDYAMQMARGLAAAHAKGIVHRDLKPENLFVTKDGQIKILDFGLAKMTSAKAAEATTVATEAMGTQPGVVMGTVGYMSPEQVRGQVADGRSDIFSLGVILYEMLLGKRAFQGESSVETMNSILKDDPPELPVTLPPALDRIIRRSIEKKQEERFQSVQDVAFALETISGTTERQPMVKPTAVRANRLVRYIIVAAIACALVAGVFLGRRTSRTPPPSFQRLTFRRGTVLSAKFAPEGRTVIYGAAWERQPVELFSTRPDSPESRPLGVAAANISGISTSGEMAIFINPHFQGFLTEAGTLARVPLAGGAPREILEDVKFADWISDSLAIVRSMGGRNRVEFPIGKVLYETPDTIGDLRVSPKGDLLAIAEHSSGWGTNWSVAVLDRKGNKRTLCTTGYGDYIYMAWSGGDEIWYSLSNGLGGGDTLHAVTLAGNERVVTRVPTLLRLFDIAHDGAVLLSRVNWRVGIIGLSPGEQKERDFSWQDASEVDDLSADGKTILTTEFGEGGGEGRWAVYLRKTDGSPAVRISEGAAFTLSPDGKWALSMRRTSPPQLVVLPTGPGEARLLKNEGFKDYSWADWLPDGRRIVFVCIEPGHAARCYLQHLEGGKPRPITPEGVVMFPCEKAISPDGRSLVAISLDHKMSLYPIEGGPPRVVTALGRGDTPIRWSKDGRSIYVLQQRGLPARIERVDLTTGGSELWQENMPADPEGNLQLYGVHLTPDGNSPFYSYIRKLSDLYLVKGLR